MATLMPHTTMYGIEIRGDYAYVASGTFLVFDISDPMSPVQVGGLANGGTDIAVEGDFAYLLRHSGFTIIDISYPTDPQWVALEWIESYACQSIAVYQDVLYIASGDDLLVYDAANKEDPVQVLEIDFDAQAYWVRVHDGVLYLSGYGYFTSLDITDPLDPIILDSISISSFDVRFVFQDSIAFLPAGGILGIDISDPSDLVELERYGLGGYVAVSGELLYYGGNGLHVVEINDFHVAHPIGEFVPDDPVQGVSGNGDLIGLATYPGGLELVDLTEPESPQSLGRTTTNGSAWNVRLSGGLAFVADGAPGLSIYDVSQPSTPQLIGSLDLEGPALDVAVGDGVAFVATGNSGLVTVDVSDPTAPQVLGQVDPSGSANRVTVQGDWASVAAGSAGLHLIDVSDPGSPALASTFPGFVSDVAVEPPFAYVIDTSEGLVIVDISDPKAPFEVASLFLPYASSPSPPRSVEVDGGFAYVASYRTGLHVVDVTAPSAPRILGNLDTSAAREIQLLGDVVLIADEGGGLKIAPRHCQDAADVGSPGRAEAGIALRLLPNPLTSSASIHLRLAEAGPVHVDLFSVDGRRVARMFEGTLDPGDHDIVWSPRADAALPPGVHFARLRQNGKTIGRAAVVVR